jgi:pimeloyl-ACP methyl ester carboxylesterase
LAPVIDPSAYAIHRDTVRDGVELAYVREGVGGVPLLLVHGWPESMRIWWRVIGPLAEAGFEVIVPDLRGFGQTGPAADGFYDYAAFSHDLHGLLEVLGHSSCVASAGDVGGGGVLDLGQRFPGLVRKQVIFNGPLPLIDDEYIAAGLGPLRSMVVKQAMDYYIRQGTDADALAAELDTPDRRRRYVAECYGHRYWAYPGSFTPEEIDFQTAPFADADVLRSSFGVYEWGMSTRAAFKPPLMFEKITVPTVALWGPADHVMFPDFPERAEIAFTDLVGPFIVQRCGHFLQWERADVLVKTLAAFCLPGT